MIYDELIHNKVNQTINTTKNISFSMG